MISTREEFDAALERFRFNSHDRTRLTGSPIEWEGNWFVEKVLQALDQSIESPLMFGTDPLYPFLATLSAQVPITTALGNFYADAVVHTPGKNTLIEYDGRAYHLDEELDDARSAAILHTGVVDQVVRFEGALIDRFPGHASFIISRIHEEAAGSSGIVLGNSLGGGSCREAWEEQKPSSKNSVYFRYTVLSYDEYDEVADQENFTVWIHRPTRQGDRVSRMLALLDHYYVRSPAELVELHRQHYPGTERR